MKKIFAAFIISLLTLVMVLSFTACQESVDTTQKDKKTICGKWIDEISGQVYEYTEDGYYYEYANENFTSIKTKYELRDGKIFYYLDGQQPDTDTGVEYSVTDDKLIIAGQLEYKRLLDKDLLDVVE